MEGPGLSCSCSSPLQMAYSDLALCSKEKANTSSGLYTRMKLTFSEIRILHAFKKFSIWIQALISITVHMDCATAG